MITRALFFLGIFLGFVGCQSPPTEIHETSEIIAKSEEELPDLFAPNTVLVDVRIHFEFLLSHISGSVNIRPEDYYQKDHEELPDPDYEGLARRLALLGISPEKNIIILGRDSDGSEAKMKWLLEFLGVKNIKVQNMKHLAPSKIRIQYKSDKESQQNVPMWKPVINEGMLAEKLKTSTTK